VVELRLAPLNTLTAITIFSFSLFAAALLIETWWLETGWRLRCDAVECWLPVGGSAAFTQDCENNRQAEA